MSILRLSGRILIRGRMRDGMILMRIILVMRLVMMMEQIKLLWEMHKNIVRLNRNWRNSICVNYRFNHLDGVRVRKHKNKIDGSLIVCLLVVYLR